MTSCGPADPPPPFPDPRARRPRSSGSNAASARAEAIVELAYGELKRLARSALRGERPDISLNATALVHEAFLRLRDQRKLGDVADLQFFSLAATTMRRVLVDHARREHRRKRGSGARPVTLHEDDAITGNGSVSLLDLDAALNELEQLDQRQARVVELRFFAGLSIQEVAEVLAISARTVNGDWRMARAWLRARLEGPAPG